MSYNYRRRDIYGMECKASVAENSMKDLSLVCVPRNSFSSPEEVRLAHAMSIFCSLRSNQESHEGCEIYFPSKFVLHLTVPQDEVA